MNSRVPSASLACGLGAERHVTRRASGSILDCGGEGLARARSVGQNGATQNRGALELASTLSPLNQAQLPFLAPIAQHPLLSHLRHHVQRRAPRRRACPRAHRGVQDRREEDD